MRKTIYLLTLIASSLFITGCGNDDDSTAQQTNFIKVENAENDLIYGIAEDYGEYSNAGIYNIDLTFLSSEFTVNWNLYSGNGYGMYFELFSSTPNKLATGTYQFNITPGAPIFDDAAYIDNSGTEELEIDIVSGTMVVTNSENNYYELTFECVDALGRTITGKFFGDVNYVSNLIP